MKIILGTKEHMTQIFDDEGRVCPVTVIKAPAVTVTHVKTDTRDGYVAVQVGAGTRRATRVSKSVKGHLGNLGPFSVLREFRVADAGTVSVGDGIDVGVFSPGDTVTVSGVSKGKGFQGVVKRHGFKGGARTHGQKHSEREPGSIGAGGFQRVFKGKRMGGRMGGERVTVRNLRIVKVDKEGGLLLVKGAVPGRRGTVVEVRG